MSGKERNWARNVSYGSTAILSPRSDGDLAALVRGAARVKALGSRHCFNDIADTTGIHVSMREYASGLEIDGDRRVARVGAGMRYGDVAEDLHRRGWALANLASLPHISVAGAVATGTHGSGDAVGSLASAVSSVRIMLASGDLVRWRRGDPDFDGVVVSLGALGVVTEIELDIVPTFDVAQTVYERVPLDAVLADLDSVTSLAYSTSMFMTWQDPGVIDQVWLKCRTDARDAAPETLLGAVPSARDLHPLPGVDAQSCTQQRAVPGPWMTRLPHFRLAFTPSNGDELQSEYLVPRAHGADALAAVRCLAPRVAPLLQVCEVRTVAADTMWLSAATGVDVVALHFTWKPDERGVRELLPELEAALEPFASRPHWGKLFDTTRLAQRLAALYPRWSDFVALRQRLDPRGVFRNDYLDALLRGGPG